MLENIRIGLAITGSFCNFTKVKNVIKKLKENKVQKIIPIVSENVSRYDTRFYLKEEFLKMLKEECNEEVITSITLAEPIGPKDMIDILLVIPCTGNTISKIANGICDTTVLMAIKSHLRNNKPVVIGISTNDALGANFENIGKVYNMKNMYFVPFNQDDYINKPKSLVLDYDKIIPTIECALEQKQIQPLFDKN